MHKRPYQSDHAGELKKLMLCRLEYDLTTFADRKDISLRGGRAEADYRRLVARGQTITWEEFLETYGERVS